MAVLAMLAVGVRVSIIMIGLALSPDLAASSLGFICQPLAENGETGSGSTVHDPAHCICGPSCLHMGQFTATADNDSLWSFSGFASAGRPLPITNSRQIFAAFRYQALIRGPPLSSI